MNLELFHEGGLVFFPRVGLVWGKVPKAAGTSLLRILPDVFGAAVTFKYTHREYLEIIFDTFPRREWNAFVFTRCPFRRFASFYRYAIKAKWRSADESFEQFAERFHERRRESDSFAKHSFSVSKFDVNLDPFFVGKVETLRESLDELSLGLKMRRFPIVPVLNASKGQRTRELYAAAPDVAAFVLKEYADDFLTGGYSKDWREIE